MTSTTKTSNYIKKNQKLPNQVSDFFKSNLDTNTRDNLIRALCESSWTYEAVANACEITRERVRQIASATQRGPNTSFPFEVPQPPLKPERQAPEYIEPQPETLKRLLELQPYAQQVRSNGTKYREEAEEYTRLLDHAHTVEKVTLYRLAKRLGITHGAIRFRLVRYGYKEAVSATSKVYTPVKVDNRHLATNENK
jgi:hypothetical protein